MAGVAPWKHAAICWLLLALKAAAVPQETLEGVALAAAGVDDECHAGAGAGVADGGCALSALQRRGLKVVPEDPDAVDLGWQPTPEKLSVQVLNNASNAVVLANCQSTYTLQPGRTIEAPMEINGGFWVLAEGEQLQCEKGCADCYYVATASTSKGATAHIGYGLEKSHLTPVGGGLELSVDGGATRQCTDDMCPKQWQKPMKIDARGSVLKVVVHGSLDGLEEDGSEPEEEEEEPAEANVTEDAEGSVQAKHRGHGGGRRGRRHRRTWWRRRPIRRTRPVYRPGRPVYRRPIYRRPRGCRWCNQHGYGTCWWLCR